MPTDLNEFLGLYTTDIQALIFAVRELVCKVYPGAIEQVDIPSRIIAYGSDRTYKGLVCAIAPQRKYVNLMFSRGTELPDPQGLLEGTGKRARHVKIRSVATAEDPAVRDLLMEAIRMGRS